MVTTIVKLFTKAQKHPKASGALLITGWITFFVWLNLSSQTLTSQILKPLVFFLWGISCILGFLTLLSSKQSHKKINGSFILVILISVLSILHFALSPIINRMMYAPVESRLCQERMHSIWNGFQPILTQNGKHFIDKWNDVLIEETNISSDTFLCRMPGSQMGKSDYALNENLVGKSLSDVSGEVVMLFESDPGWNVTAGLVKMSFSNHKVWFVRVCNVVLVDGSVIAVSKDEAVTLQWE